LTISDEIGFCKESNSYIFFKNISPTDGKCQ